MKNAALMLENMGDKPALSQNAINFLNSHNKAQLQFVGVTNRFDRLFQARKYVIKDSLAKEVIAKANHLVQRTQDFKNLFKDVFNQGLPFFWTKEGMFVSEVNYLTKLREKAKDTSMINILDPIINGMDIFQVLDKDLFLFHETRQIIYGLPPPSYNLYSDLDTLHRYLITTTFPPSLVWKKIAELANKTISQGTTSSNALVPFNNNS